MCGEHVLFPSRNLSCHSHILSRFLMEKNCWCILLIWWSNVCHEMFAQSQINIINLDQWKAYFRKAPQTMAVKSPKLVYEDGQFHQRIRKRPWNSSPWSENVLGQNDGQISFIRNEPVWGVSNCFHLSFLLYHTLPRCLQAKSGSKHPIWPPGTRVKNVSKTSWKIHRIFCWWNGQSQFVGHEKMVHEAIFDFFCATVQHHQPGIMYIILCIFMYHVYPIKNVQAFFQTLSMLQIRLKPQ